MAVASQLETELRVFEEHRKEWSREHLGQFVVIREEKILDGFFDDYGVAFNAGLHAFGISQNFLVKQIWVEEPVYFVA